MTIPSLFDDATPAGYRETDPHTSKQAAITPFRRGSQRHVLLMCYVEERAFLLGGLTDAEACDLTGIVGGWKRLSELRALGLIEPTGITRTSPMHGEQRVCRVAFEGRRALGLIT
jgi:hypothetical protein